MEKEKRNKILAKLSEIVDLENSFRKKADKIRIRYFVEAKGWEKITIGAKILVSAFEAMGEMKDFKGGGFERFVDYISMIYGEVKVGAKHLKGKVAKAGKKVGGVIKEKSPQ